MKREPALLVAAALLLVGTVGLVAAAPGALDDPREPDRVPPGSIGVTEQGISPGAISGATAELDLHTDLEHRRGPVENVTVRYRAIDSDSGMLVDEQRVDVGDVDRDGEFTVNSTLAVPRDGGYTIETVVFSENDRVASTSTRVAGVAALTPAYADTDVGFTESNVWPTVAVSVVEADERSATLRISASVTNRGDEVSDQLDLGVVLRQADSNVVADRGEATVDEIRPGRTDTVDVTVTVPADYNYYVDAALWQDDVLIDEHGSVANLNPQETISANETVEDVEFEVGDFATDSAPESTPSPAEEREERPVEDDTPGFGAAVAVIALLAAALLARRTR